MNFSSIVTEAQRLAGRVDNDWQPRTKRWINEAQEQWAIAVPWPTLVKEEDFTNFGTRSMVLPPRVKGVLRVADKTNAMPLDRAQHWDREAPNQFYGNSNGQGQWWRELGFTSTLRQPAATAVFSCSTPQSCTVNVYVAGLALDTTASGTADQYYFARDVVNVAGSGVYTGTKLFYQIDTVGKDAYTPGDVVVRDGSSNILARVLADSYRSQYRTIDILPIPVSGTVFNIQYTTAPESLIDTWQIPHTAVDIEYLIWYAAGMIAKAQAQEQQSASCLARAKEILDRRIYKERGQGDQDWRVLPSPDYWGHDDWLYEVPGQGR